MKQPNILFLITDQHRFTDLNCLGNELLTTPNLDSLYNESVVFTNAYTASPVCGPARASIKTGTYPPVNGVTNNYMPFCDNVDLLMDKLKLSGYETMLAGKLHFTPCGESFGFDKMQLNDAPYSIYANEDKRSKYIDYLRDNYSDCFKEDIVKLFDDDEVAFDDDIYRFIMGSFFRKKDEQHDASWVTDRSIEYLNERNEEKPFFLMTSFFGPHQPYGVPEPYNSMIKPEDVTMPPQFKADMHNSPVFNASAKGLSDRLRKTFDDNTYKKLRAAYLNQINMIDHHIGRLFDTLKEKGLWDNTIVIFTSDHGDHNGSYGLFFKGEMYDSCAKIPMFIKPATKNTQNKLVSKNVSSLDLYSTMLEATTGDNVKNDNVASRSLCDFIIDKEIEWDNKTFSIIGRDKAHVLSMVKRDDYKLIRYENENKEVLYELYDHESDPYEMKNIYNSKNCDIEPLKSELDSWVESMIEIYPMK